MAYQPSASTVNKFIGGLKTEFTGIDFPDDSCTDIQNCVISIIGDITRRLGFDYEANFTQQTINRTGAAINSYIWNNVGGDGQTKIVVVQVGTSIYFYQMTNATVAAPLSTTFLSAATFTLSSFTAPGGSFSASTECQFSDGNGYLFIYHPSCEPVYCTYLPGVTPTVTPNLITVQIRDFVGINPEPGNPKFSARPAALNAEHNYNLQNQGWTNATQWSASSATQNFTVSGASLVFNPGGYTFNVGTVNGIAAGQQVVLSVSGILSYVNNGVGYGSGYTSGNFTIAGSVTSYTNPNVTINVTSAPGVFFTVPGSAIGAINSVSWSISQSNAVNTINTFFSGVGVYPSNTDIWFEFKNTSNVFSPSTTVSNVSLSNAPAPKGHFLLNAFSQQRTATSGIASLTNVSTTIRPRTGCWFQGRVFYSGVDASQQATGDQGYYTWTENIYFSQIIDSPTEFGFCYQENDPTDENLFDVLPTDGGVITIQGSGAIYKLFPIQNGLLVFAANGVWFITGSQGIGFSATDYTITKISGVQCISGNSFINVLGYPIFWNEDGIYAVVPGQSGSIQLENIALGTILTFYQNIPLQSKKFARGDFDYVNHEIQWCYRSTNESSTTDRYQFDRVLVYNIVNKSFYYYTLNPTLSNGTVYIHDIKYVVGPGGSTSPSPVFKYLSSFFNGATFAFTFAEEKDAVSYRDFKTQDGTGINYISFFTTGYKMSPRKHPYYGLYAQMFKKFNIGYIYLFLRNTVANSYKIQTLWEFSTSGNSGKWSAVEQRNDNTNTTNFGMLYRRHKLRGHGLAMQIKIQSVDSKPFDIMGWSTSEYFQDKP